MPDNWKITNVQPACISKNKYISCKAAGILSDSTKKKTPLPSRYYRDWSGANTSSKGSCGKQLVFQLSGLDRIHRFGSDGFFNYWIWHSKDRTGYFKEVGCVFLLTQQRCYVTQAFQTISSLNSPALLFNLF